MARTDQQASFASFRARLLIAMTFIVLAITLLGLYIAQEKVAAETEHDLQRDFTAALASARGMREVRQAALAERCRGLVRRPRIHAALEDNALDLLYPSARDEMRDVMDDNPSEQPAPVLRARFYRFLDGKGAVISPPNAADVGDLRAGEEARLALPRVPEHQEIGYLPRATSAAGEIIDEVIAMPIVSTETGEVIAALVLGFEPAGLGNPARVMMSGLWIAGGLHLPALHEAARSAVSTAVARALTEPREGEHSLRLTVEGLPHQLFVRRLNPGSLFPPAYEVCIYPLTELLARQRQLRWQAAAACALLLLGGIVASHVLAARLSRPVEKLAVDSEENRTQRARAEAALELTSEELQRAARFSADTSHQLKTPVTVLRAGLEELLAHNELSPEIREELAALIHQTFRLNNIIEDLLLLSRMDAGRLQIEFTPVNLNRLIEAWLDDLSAIPEGPDVEVEIDLPEALEIAGEPRYTTLNVQNLLVNARKYNRPGGEIRIEGHEEGEWAVLTIANTGRPIPPSVQSHIFERFHRGLMAENVPGHGLGLNLARELVRLHHGDLRLVRSDEEWTVFEVRFRVASRPPVSALQVA
jgi:signal transduction histidine kinase